MTTPFRIAVPDAVLDDLRARLARTRWPDQIPGSGWDYGADTAYLRELTGYWLDGYDWRAQEARLNALPHFLARIDGFDIHYLHLRSTRPDAVPLLLLHGWPSSFLQMLDIAPLLAEPADRSARAFDVVIGSLPGFGFSSIPAERGIGFRRIGALFHALMNEVLGYTRYGLRGSDLGASISVQMALAQPAAVAGVHLTGIIGTRGVPQGDLSEAERAFVAATQALELPEMAYARLHMSKPQTLAHALHDSPVGLAAWIVEKFRSWGDTGGALETRFSKDQLLNNLMVYWVTGTIGASVRLYYEFLREQALTGRVGVPVGMLMSHRDLFPPAPREWGERLYNIVRWTDTQVGGHFLEWEEPALVARELSAFFGALE